MTVRKRGARWVVDFFFLDERGNRKRLRRSLGPDVRSKRQAELEEARIRADFDLAERARQHPHLAPQSCPPAAFSGFARKWMDVHVNVNCKPSTQRRNESILRVHLVPYFGDRELATITSLDVEQFKAANSDATVEKTGRKLDPKTVNEHLGVLSSMLEAAVRWGYLHRNPCRRVRRLKVPPREFRFYDAEQTLVFLAKAAKLEPGYHTLFLTGFRTGMRLGEILALEWGDLDFTKRQVHVRRSFHRGQTTSPKSNLFRVVPMTTSLVEALQQVRHLKGDLVFCRPDGGHLNRDILKHPWKRVQLASGLPYIRIHDMRHSYASQLVMKGVPMKVVATWLGHSETRITERYAHLSPEAVQGYVDVLEEDVRPLGESRQQKRS